MIGAAKSVSHSARQQSAPYILQCTDPEEYLFSPWKSEIERRKAQSAARVTPLSCGNVPKLGYSPRAGDQYDSATYRRAILRACKAAGVPPWTPHQLRHSAGTEIRAMYGVEEARLMMGHRSLKAAEVYARADLEKIARVVGLPLYDRQAY